ncbi:GntR family transcriptional regulator [Pseudomaricurvus alkylphenolicus]|uniref:CvfB family protein n=1 Tax=Pseudomaricurvus alkylphenolicus TaxID=1306991 RepID=UPI00141E5A85|nr:S1-like domain-containing RNA-binding protein [Pseudomaricurvus alkylphenolicus]NIB44571.1 GntR family transcriptional regulator [Pseudomaricurvus alkylphenolicus]
MVSIGQINHLKVVKQVDFGVFLDGGSDGNILLPRRYVPQQAEVGNSLDVFIYLDSEDDLIATTETPKVMVGECAYLKVTDVNQHGAFLDWGLSKELLVPFNEQHRRMEEGKSYVVTVYLDKSTQRLAASSRLSKHLQEHSRRFRPQQAVDLLISDRSDMGYKAVINHTHLGLIFRDDAFKPLKTGTRIKGYIKDIRRDGKIDLSLQLPPVQQRDALTEEIMAHLEANGGVSNLTDKSPPDDIYQAFNVSKGSYKKALGALYKARRIVIEKERIRLPD